MVMYPFHPSKYDTARDSYKARDVVGAAGRIYCARSMVRTNLVENVKDATCLVQPANPCIEVVRGQVT